VLAGFQNDPIKDRLVIPVGKDKKGKPVNLIVFPAKKDGKTYAVAFESTAGGYHGEIGVMLGVNLTDQTLTGISIVSHTETPGLGARIVEPSFTDSFKGKPMDKPLAVGDINALSGATFSTKGVVEAVNKAQAILSKYRDKMVK
jgi:electron transport complex protein RnfG